MLAKEPLHLRPHIKSDIIIHSFAYDKDLVNNMCFGASYTQEKIFALILYYAFFSYNYYLYLGAYLCITSPQVDQKIKLNFGMIIGLRKSTWSGIGNGG